MTAGEGVQVGQSQKLKTKSEKLKPEVRGKLKYPSLTGAGDNTSKIPETSGSLGCPSRRHKGRDLRQGLCARKVSLWPLPKPHRLRTLPAVRNGALLEEGAWRLRRYGTELTWLSRGSRCLPVSINDHAGQAAAPDRAAHGGWREILRNAPAFRRIPITSAF